MSMWQKTVGMGAIASLVAIASPTGASAVPETTSQNRSDYRIAQQRVVSDCRRVDASGGLNVRERPTTNSRVIGVLANGAQVRIESWTEDWVPLEEPMAGYVYKPYLDYCNPSASLPENCAKVEAVGGLNVRRRPTTDSGIVRTLENDRYISLEEPYSDEWAEIYAPVSGYVATDYLQSCAADRQVGIQSNNRGFGSKSCSKFNDRTDPRDAIPE